MLCCNIVFRFVVKGLSVDKTNLLNTPLGKRGHEIGYWGLLLVACVAFWRMNVLTPFKEDDMEFYLVGQGTLLDVLRYWRDHYLTTNGRISDAVGVIFCGFLGKAAFDVCNTLVFALMTHMLSILSTGRRSIMVVAMFLAYVGCSYPVPGETMLMVNGTCNYMWAITASLLLVYYLLRSKDTRLSPLKGILLFLCALIAGNFNEATSFGFLGGMCLYYAFNRKRLSPVVMVALAGYLVGVLLIVASPAAWNRAANGGIVVDLGLGELLSSRWNIFSEKVWRFITPVAAFVVGVAALLWKGIRPVKESVWTYIILCLAVVLFGIGNFSQRIYSPISTVAFIVVAMAADVLLARWSWQQWLRLLVIVAGLMLSVYTGARALRVINMYKIYEDNNVKEINQAPRQAILLEREFDGYSRFVTPLRYVSSDYFVREELYCAFYKKDNMQFVSDSVYNRFHSGRLLDGAVPMPLVCDRKDVTDTFYSFPDQDYMVAVLKMDKYPFTQQQAVYYNAPGALTEAELAYRHKYGLVTESTPHGFYPVYYQDKLLLVFPLMDEKITRVVFPLNDENPPVEATITWQTNSNN